MGLIDRIFGAPRTADARRLYAAIVAEARAPHWYLDGAVPDTIDGRFDMIAAILSIVLIRLEREPAGAAANVALTEQFITDMDGQLRESGIGDVGIGKHVGQMMSMLGGRIGAYREALGGGDIAAVLRRNLYRGEDPGAAALAHVSARLQDVADRVAARPIEKLLDGTFS